MGAINSVATVQASHYQKSYPNGQRSNTKYPNGQRFSHKRPSGQSKDNRGPKLEYDLRQQLYKDGKCYQCQKTGHTWRECPNRK